MKTWKATLLITDNCDGGRFQPLNEIEIREEIEDSLTKPQAGVKVEIEKIEEVTIQ